MGEYFPYRIFRYGDSDLFLCSLDDAGLARLVGSTPAHSIILIEDIDCAFPSREELEKQKKAKESGITLAETKSTITLSGLLNVIDGVSSEEGRLLFSTVSLTPCLPSSLPS